MAPLEARVSKETLAALKTDLTLRCLLTAHFKHKTSRHSNIVIAWAHSRAEKVSRLLLCDIGQPTTDFSIQMNIIQMLPTSSKVFICYDLFLSGCDKQLRDEIHRSFTFERPVHQIVRRGDIYHITRNKELEQIVAEQYSGMRRFDLGPLPLFADYQNPPFFIDGRRVEDYGQEEDEHNSGESEEHAPSEPGEVKHDSPANFGDVGTEHLPTNEGNLN